MNNNVNFEVVSIEKAKKPECVVVTVKFHNTDKIYTYVRKAFSNCTIIDGCKIRFDDDMNFRSVERIYSTKGVKKSSTAKQVGKTSSKIKEELNSLGIVAPQVPEVPAPEFKASSGVVRHAMYNDIKTCLAANIPVYLAGPAGSGKNFTVEQIAKEMGWNFYFSNSVQQEYKLTGFIDAGGKYHETEFYKACTDENECVFFLDEMDASIPDVLVLLNAAIANGYFEFPNGRVDFDHVHFVAAGNTVGNGADDMYTGRMVLDQATLDRFAIIEFGYDTGVEMSLTNNNNELVSFIHQLRDQAEEKGIRATFSYRCMTMITKLESSGMDLVMAMKISVVKGMDKDTVNTLTPAGSTKYHEALRKLQRVA